MGILMDVVLIAIFLLNVILGYKKGLVNVIFSICAFLIAIVATFLLYKPVSNFMINNTQIDEKIRETIINYNTNKEENGKESDAETTNLQKSIEKMIENTAKDAKTETTEIIADAIANRGVEILTGILLFMAIRIVLVILKFLISGITELPILKQFNQIGGLAYGILRGLVIIYLLLTILFFVISINEEGLIAEAIENSYITKFLYHNNIIVNYCLLGKNLL